MTSGRIRQLLISTAITLLQVARAQAAAGGPPPGFPPSSGGPCVSPKGAVLPKCQFSPVCTVVSPTGVESFGSAVSSGNFDGDANAEIVVGAPGQTVASKVFVIDNTCSIGAPLLTLTGGTADGFGSAVAVGQLVGSATPDVVVGAFLGAFQAGEVHVFDGQTGSLAWKATGSGAEWLGFSVAIGDADGDGDNEVLAGAAQGGKVNIYDGQAGGAPLIVLTNPGYGISVAAGDVGDTDTADEVLAGVFGLSGNAAHVIDVNLSGPSFSVKYAVTGTAPNDLFGERVAMAGNLDGIAGSEIIVGAPRGSGSSGVEAIGYVRVCAGTTGAALYERYGTTTNDRFGSWVAGAGGDVDNDGSPDVLVGAPENAPGYVSVLSGTAGTVKLVRFGLASGTTPGDRYGLGVAGGDVNGDGRPDAIIGAPGGFELTEGYVEVVTK